MCAMTDDEEVLAAARRRSQALPARDAAALTRLHHPDLRWTTRTGEVLNRDQYVFGNTASDLVWRSQELHGVEVVVVGRAAVLTAVAVDEVEGESGPNSFRLRTTQTWVWAPDTCWRCLAGHAGPEV